MSAASGAGGVVGETKPASDTLRLLAITYDLPPVLTPQSIQIDRLLASLDAGIATVTGPLASGEARIDAASHWVRPQPFRAEIAFRPAIEGLALSLAKRFVPFYGAIPDEFRGWVSTAVAVALDKIKSVGFQPDLLVTFGEPMSDHLVGLHLKRHLNIPWLAHWSDPWYDNPFRSGQFIAKRINRQLEAQVIEAADRIVFTSKETLDLVMGKFPITWREKCVVLGHSYDPALYPQTASRSDTIVVRHVGSFYGNRTPLPLLRALARMDRRHLDGVRFEFVGRVPRWLPLHPAWRRLPPGLVHCENAVAYRRALALMAEADLLLVIDAPSELSVFLPSKLVEYIGASAPIMGITPPGTSASLIRRLGGIVADPRRIEEIAAGLELALTEVRGRRSDPQRSWGDEMVRREFAVDRIAPRFQAIVAETVRRAKLQPMLVSR